MKAFQFRLERVLDWRRVQLEIEETKFQEQLAAAAQLDAARAELEAAAVSSEVAVRAWRPLSGGDLEALGRFRDHVYERQQAIAALRAECQQQLAAQERAMQDARRRCRLLERLKERHYAEWQAASDRESEQLAAEAHLAGLTRLNSGLRARW